MNYWLISAACSLATFFVVLVSAGVCVERAAGRLSRSAAAAPARRANLFFLLATLPFSIAATLAFGLVLPAFLRLEPRGSTERLDWPLAIAAICGALTLLLYFARAAVLLWQSRAGARRWLRAGRSVALGHEQACEVRDASGVLAVSGTLRPRYFISSDVFAALSANELAAAFAHEAGHVHARDNCKRLLLHALALPGQSFARVRAEWSASAELAADEAAVLGGTPVLDLASALVAVARLRGSAGTVSPGFSCLLPPDGAPLLGMRIARLLQLLRGDALALPQQHNRRPVLAALLAAAALLVWTYPAVLAAAHAALEKVI
jgi:Zn-dependent protease with chaperone function